MAKRDLKNIAYYSLDILNMFLKTITKYYYRSMRLILKSSFRNAIPFLYDKLCIKYIWEDFHPPATNNTKRPPSTLFIKILAVYITVFGLVSIRYEQSIGRIENRVSNIYYQSEGEGWKAFFSKIPEVQRIKVPYRPMLNNPISVFYSIWPSNDAMDVEVIRELQDLVNSKKSKLTGMILNNLILSEIMLVDGALRINTPRYFSLDMRNFTNSNFTNSWLLDAILSNTDFQNSLFNGAALQKAQLTNCNLSNTQFRAADLIMADLTRSNLSSADLRGAVLMGTDLRGSILIGANLHNAYDLHTAKLKAAWYNSKEIKITDDLISNISLNALCSNTRMSDESCPHLITSFPYGIGGAATIFPEGFNPKEHGMLDASEIIDLVRYSTIE